MGAPKPEDRGLPPLSLGAGQVHVWRVALDGGDEAERRRLWRLLSPDEESRAGQFIFQPDRDRFVSCRAQLRQLLGRYLGLDPRQLVFKHGPHGKPALSGVGPPPIQFNVSHSGPLALLAFSSSGPVGVDVEQIDRKIDIDAIRRHFFHPDEPRDESRDRFFRRWVCKEAVLKMFGEGVAGGMDRVRIELADDGQGGVSCRLEPDRPEVCLSLLELGDHFAAAVCSATPASITCYQW